MKREAIYVSLLLFIGRFNNLMLENKFKTKLIKEIRARLPGAIVLHTNPPPQGIPDLLVLYEDRWAALEGKKETGSSHRPNQNYWIDKMNRMSFAAFISPENKEEVLHAMERSFSV